MSRINNFIKPSDFVSALDLAHRSTPSSSATIATSSQSFSRRLKALALATPWRPPSSPIKSSLLALKADKALDDMQALVRSIRKSKKSGDLNQKTVRSMIRNSAIKALAEHVELPQVVELVNAMLKTVGAPDHDLVREEKALLSELELLSLKLKAAEKAAKNIMNNTLLSERPDLATLYHMSLKPTILVDHQGITQAVGYRFRGLDLSKEFQSILRSARMKLRKGEDEGSVQNWLSKRIGGNEEKTSFLFKALQKRVPEIVNRIIDGESINRLVASFGEGHLLESPSQQLGESSSMISAQAGMRSHMTELLNELCSASSSKLEKTEENMPQTLSALSDLRKDIRFPAYEKLLLAIEDALGKKQPVIAKRLVEDLETRFFDDTENGIFAARDDEKIWAYLEKSKLHVQLLNSASKASGIDGNKVPVMQTGSKSM
jgi:hypothetical protein